MNDGHQANDQQPFANLTPDTILAAIESQGLVCDGHLLALNSYENRVYQIGIDQAAPVIAKFYRPGRWDNRAIIEEHRFAQELADHEVPLIAPLKIADCSLFEYDGYRFSLAPRRAGRAAELDQLDVLEWLGRFIGRLHKVGAAADFSHRPELTAERLGWNSRRYLLEQRWLPAHLESAFESLSEDLLAIIDARFAAVDYRPLRLHGDFHAGNILWRDGPFFVDLDDCQTGPAIQDLWLLLSGDRDQMSAQCRRLIQGYAMFMSFNPAELALIEPLRTLRMLHHAAWLARRWGDPAFPVAFPWFDSVRYWEELMLGLREQMAQLQEAPIEL